MPVTFEFANDGEAYVWKTFNRFLDNLGKTPAGELKGDAAAATLVQVAATLTLAAVLGDEVGALDRQLRHQWMTEQSKR